MRLSSVKQSRRWQQEANPSVSQWFWLQPADWHEHDMSSAAHSPTLRAETITTPSEVQQKKREIAQFLLNSAVKGRGLSFSSLWVGGSRLRFVTQWTWRRRSGVWCSVSLDPDKGGRRAAVGPKSSVVTHSWTPPALPTAVTKISDPVMQTLRSQHHASNHTYRCLCCAPDFNW